MYKCQHPSHPKDETLNQSFTYILNDLHRTNDGYFIWNPIYKAHKKDVNDDHISKVRPIISSNKSPFKPMLKLIAEGCNIIIVVQNMYNITNVGQDSFHFIKLINDYIL